MPNEKGEGQFIADQLDEVVVRRNFEGERTHCHRKTGTCICFPCEPAPHLHHYSGFKAHAQTRTQHAVFNVLRFAILGTAVCSPQWMRCTSVAYQLLHQQIRLCPSSVCVSISMCFDSGRSARTLHYTVLAPMIRNRGSSLCKTRNSFSEALYFLVMGYQVTAFSFQLRLSLFLLMG